jgi:cell division protein FtsW
MHRNSVYLLVLGVAVLMTLGIVMLFSTSAFAHDAHGDPYFFVKRQIMWLGVGLFVCIIASRLDYHFWQKTWWIWYLLAMALLVLCFVHPIGQKINGSSRWIGLHTGGKGMFTFQPSELAKFAAVAALAWWFSRREESAGEFIRGFVYPLILGGVLMGLIAPEVDMGSTALIGATTFTVMFVAGSRLRFLVPMILFGFCGLGFAVWKMPERMGRFMAFIEPEKHPADYYQQFQGLIAFGSGGIEGLGLGNGRQKAGYLPEAHTDFIFPTMGEELGLRVTLVVILAYVCIIMAAAVIVSRARDRFGTLLGSGLIVIVALQAAVNIGVTTAVLPNKGLPLPFVSYGGSNLVFCLLVVGVLINIYRQGLSDREVRAVQLAVTTRRKGRVRF